VLTDTFQLGETGDGTGTWDVFPVNNARATKQKALDIRVILGNPPYSAGQESANDNNANLKYPRLDASIAATYAKRSTATLKNSLYDSYVRAIRWASDRLLDSPQGGVVAFVTNGGYIDSNTADGLRLTLANEFHHLYVFNLRGNQRTAGEVSRMEGGKIFDAGSRATVAIMLLVKQPGHVTESSATVRYRDIGDYLSRHEKLAILAAALPIPNDGPPVLGDLSWTTIQPNLNGDWINQRSESFAKHLPAQSNEGPSVFQLRTRGLLTSRDAWNYNSSRSILDGNATGMIKHYNAQAEAFAAARLGTKGTLNQRAELAKKFVDLDPTKFSWSRTNFTAIARGTRLGDADRLVMTATYRPFHRRWVDTGRRLNDTVSQLPRVFPSAAAENLVIGVLDIGSPAPFAALCAKALPDDKLVGAGNAMQFFPRYVYENADVADEAGVRGLFDYEPATDSSGRRHNVTDHALVTYQALDPAIDRDDIFFYVYGILHSPDYRTTFAADLKKSLPRVPQVTTAEAFWTFSKMGRSLVHLHTDYESIEVWPELTYTYSTGFDAHHPDAYRVLKMKHPRITDPHDPKGAKVDDRSRIVYNDWITIGAIPERAYDYVLGSRSAVAWVMESNRLRTDKASGIRNDPNDWAIEHDNPTYILDLVGRVVTVSMRTLDIVDSLPRLNL
jgi:predicted helicase